MSTYRERLSPPLSWWLAAAAFALTCGWVVLVATTREAGGLAAGAVAAGALVALLRSGRVVEVDASTVRVGTAHIDRAWTGPPQVLDAGTYRRRLGTGADARAFLATRPWAERGVLLPVTDPADPTPYWVIGSRNPDLLAAALAADPEPSTSKG